MFGCYVGEGRVPREISFQELHLRVGEIAAALKSFGVKQGDRIAGILMNTHNITYYYIHYIPLLIRVSTQLCIGCRSHVSDIKFRCNLVLNFTGLWCLGKQ